MNASFCERSKKARSWSLFRVLLEGERDRYKKANKVILLEHCLALSKSLVNVSYYFLFLCYF